MKISVTISKGGIKTKGSADSVLDGVEALDDAKAKVREIIAEYRIAEWDGISVTIKRGAATVANGDAVQPPHQPQPEKQPEKGEGGRPKWVQGMK